MLDDLLPFARYAIGYNQLGSLNTKNTYPPYNLSKQSETEYRIEIAVAGFTADELEISKEKDILTIRGSKSTSIQNDPKYIHRGIAARSFDLTFQLNSDVDVGTADIVNGLLIIDFTQIIPKEKQKQTIAIGQPAEKKKTKQLLNES